MSAHLVSQTLNATGFFSGEEAIDKEKKKGIDHVSQNRELPARKGRLNVSLASMHLRIPAVGLER